MTLLAEVVENVRGVGHAQVLHLLFPQLNLAHTLLGITLIRIHFYWNFQICVLCKVRYARAVALGNEFLGYQRGSFFVQGGERRYIGTLLFPLDTYAVNIVVFGIEGTAAATAALHLLLPLALIDLLLVHFEERTAFSQVIGGQVVLVGVGNVLEGSEILVCRFLILSIYENCLLFHINYLFIYFIKSLVA
ncbi:MAG: hypothetical protein ACMG6E_05650 [Candidatus Roizmanbacteria bacterium]